MRKDKSKPAGADREDSTTQCLEQIESKLGAAWLPRIYRERIRTIRTRAYELAPGPKVASPQIQHTLLGIELQVGRRRMLCPDLATARYLAVFARIGATNFAVPYDISRISRLADELESSWHRMMIVLDGLAAGRTAAFCARLRRQLVAKVRTEIVDAGAGEPMPEFKRSTKQRRPQS